MKKILTIAASIILLSACASTEVKTTHTKEVISEMISNKKFIIEAINDKKIMYNKGMSVNFKNNKKTNISFISGNTGCNRFFADYIISDDKIKLKNIQTTKMICMNDEALNNEVLILSILRKEMKITIDKNHFYFEDNNKNIISFKKPRKRKN